MAIEYEHYIDGLKQDKRHDARVVFQPEALLKHQLFEKYTLKIKTRP
jgi:hypothetical protein